MSENIDIGHGVYMRWLSWSPDRDLNPQYEGIEDEDRTGVIVGHVHDDGAVCEGGVLFDTPANRFANEQSREAGRPEHPLWAVHSLDPLHIEPSILVRLGTQGPCGLHGFIRNGRWAEA